MALQKYIVAANASNTAVNITNDKNDQIYSLSGDVCLSVIQRPYYSGGSGLAVILNGTDGTLAVDYLSSGGSGYTNGTYTNVTLLGLTGVGAKYTVVVAGGAVTTVTKTTSGSGYTNGDSLTTTQLPYGYDSIVITDANLTPNANGQSLILQTNQFSTIAGVSVTSYTTTQLMNALQSLMSSIVSDTVVISGTITPSLFGLGAQAVNDAYTIPVTASYTAKYAITDNATEGSAHNLVFQNVNATAAGQGYITKIRFMTDNTAWASTNAAVLKLHLFHTAPTPLGNNAAYTLLYSNAANRIGTITFNALTTEGSGSTASYALWTGALKYKLAAASTTIYGILEVDSFSGTMAASSLGAGSAAQNIFIEISTDNF